MSVGMCFACLKQSVHRIGGKAPTAGQRGRIVDQVSTVRVVPPA